MIATDGQLQQLQDAVNVLNLRGRAERLGLQVNRAIDCRSIEEAQFSIKHSAARLVLQLQTHIYAMPGETAVLSISQPADWWEAFRARWFPSWWIKRYPIKFVVDRAERQLYARMCPHLQEDELVCHLAWLDRSYGDGSPPDIRDPRGMPADQILSNMIHQLAWMRDKGAIYNHTRHQGDITTAIIRLLADLREAQQRGR